MTGPRRLDLEIPDPEVRAALATLRDGLAAEGGRALVVGGTVRDALLGLPAEELDVEVHGIEPERLVAWLRERFTVDLVGRAFGVVKLHHLPIDVAVPRRESKSGLGHRGFEVLSDPHLGVEEAARRRDFTVNAMAWDPATGEVIDPHGGLSDLENRVLRHVSARFSEDPLRVLRGMQFAARFDLEPAEETVALCRGIEPEGLARERIFEEWRKLVLTGRTPSRGLRFLRETGWVRYFPELEALIGVPQDPEWHPEGDVWVHTLHAMDAFAGERLGDPWEDLVVGFAVLCHDLGKPATTEFEEGRWRSKRHEPEGEEPTRRFLGRMTDHRDLVEAVVPLVLAHLRPVQLFEARSGDAAIRRLARTVKRIDRLVRVARADQQGRPPLPFEGFPAGEWLLERAHELEVADAAPKPLMQGRHLIKLGLRPGPRFGEILERLYEAQLDGVFSTEEGGLELARRILAELGD